MMFILFKDLGIFYNGVLLFLIGCFQVVMEREREDDEKDMYFLVMLIQKKKINVMLVDNVWEKN